MEIKQKIGLQSEAVTLLEKLTGVAVIKRIPIISRLTEIVALLVAAVVTYVAPIFKRAKSIAEFHKNSESFARSSDSIKGVQLDTLNDCGESLLEAFDRFKMPAMKYFGSGARGPTRVRLGGRANACYVEARGRGFNSNLIDQININTNLTNEPVSVVQHRREIQEYRHPFAAHKQLAMKRARDKRVIDVLGTLTEWPWSHSDGKVKNTMYHEAGHRYHSYMRSQGRDLDNIVLKAFRDGWGYVLSQYGMTNDKEFMAESFSCYMQGKHDLICPELLTFLKQHDQAVAA